MDSCLPIESSATGCVKIMWRTGAVRTAAIERNSIALCTMAGGRAAGEPSSHPTRLVSSIIAASMKQFLSAFWFAEARDARALE
jgi:hypothetical protein